MKTCNLLLAIVFGHFCVFLLHFFVAISEVSVNVLAMAILWFIVTALWLGSYLDQLELNKVYKIHKTNSIK